MLKEGIKILSWALTLIFSFTFMAPGVMTNAKELKSNETEFEEKIDVELDINLDNYNFSTEEELIEILDKEIEKFGAEIQTRSARIALGTKKTVTARLSNATISAIGGLSWTAKIGRIEKILISAMGGSVLTWIGVFKDACLSVAAINAAAGYAGFAIDITSTWTKSRAYDTDQWVEYVGWGAMSYSKPYRYK